MDLEVTTSSREDFPVIMSPSLESGGGHCHGEGEGIGGDQEERAESDVGNFGGAEENEMDRENIEEPGVVKQEVTSDDEAFLEDDLEGDFGDYLQQLPRDEIVKIESFEGINCPVRLQGIGEPEVCAAFAKCHRNIRIRSQVKYNYKSKGSMFAKVFALLTGNDPKYSDIEERRYLYELWTVKYKHFFDKRDMEMIKKSKDMRGKHAYRTKKLETLAKRFMMDYPETLEPPKTPPPMEEEIEEAMPIIMPDFEGEREETTDPAAFGHEEVSEDDPEESVKILEISKLEHDQGKYLEIKLLRLTLEELLVLGKGMGKGGLEEGKRVARQRGRRKRRCAEETAMEHDEEDDGLREADDDPDWNPAAEETSQADKVQKAVSKGTKSCSVCGLPSNNQKLLSYHLKTHMNDEEKRRCLREKMERVKLLRRERRKLEDQPPISRAMKTEMRILELEQFLRVRQRKVEIETYRQRRYVPAAEIDPSRYKNRRKYLAKLRRNNPNHKTRSYTKRDGNYGPGICSQCGKVFKTFYKLGMHEKAQHDGIKPTCTICGKPCASRNNMFNHLKTHLNSEEQQNFLVWPGEIVEFLERLDSGEDLGNPPRKRIRNKNAKPRTIPRKRGRPVKHQNRCEDKRNGEDNLDQSNAPMGYGENAGTTWGNVDDGSGINQREAFFYESVI